MHRLSRRHPVPVLAGGDFQGWLEGAGTLPFGLVASNPLKPGAEGPGGAAEGVTAGAGWALDVWWRGDLVTEGTSRSGT